MKRVILLFAVAIAVGLYVYYHIGVRSNDNPTSATYYGSIEIRRVNLGFRVGGKIATLEREEGEFVRWLQSRGSVRLIRVTILHLKRMATLNTITGSGIIIPATIITSHSLKF